MAREDTMWKIEFQCQLVQLKPDKLGAEVLIMLLFQCQLVQLKLFSEVVKAVRTKVPMPIGSIKALSGKLSD